MLLMWSALGGRVYAGTIQPMSRKSPMAAIRCASWRALACMVSMMYR